VLAAPLAAQERTRIDTAVTVGRDAVVDLALVSGDITVTAAEGAQVRVRGTSTRGGLRFEHRGNAVRVWIEREDRRRWRDDDGGEERLEVAVPVGARVTANTVSGGVSVRAVRGEIEARSVSGDVDVEGAVRRLRAASVSGDVRVTRVEGDVRVESVSGDATIDDVAGEIDAQTVSGEIDVRRARTARVRAQTVSGEVTYDGTLARDGRYDFTTHSGEVRIVVPADAGATLSMRSFSGSIDSDAPLTLQSGDRMRDDDDDRRGPRTRRAEYTLGGGGARVNVETFSGDIQLVRPGRRP
jgi:DUF4097 and DUF4098 domain-containing protein YvlB